MIDDFICFKGFVSEIRQENIRSHSVRQEVDV